MTKYVTTYENPDTDGVCGSVAFVELAEMTGLGDFEAIYFGRLNQETTAALSGIGHPGPRLASEVMDAETVALVDTHSIVQLPPGIRPQLVRHIIDHHRDGDAEAFAGADIQNELVGAACTLIVERFVDAGYTPSLAVARLLGCGIVSNTLDFVAPSTTERDRRAFDWLSDIAPLPESIISTLRSARSSFLDLSTNHVVGADVKLYTVNARRIAMSQVEAHGAAALLDRTDFWMACREVLEEYAADALIVNAVDLTAMCSRLAVTDIWVQSRLQARFGIRFVDDLAWTEQLFLRKTHLVPALIDP